MDEATNKALRFINDNKPMVMGIASMAESFREESRRAGETVDMEVMANFIFDTFVDITTVNGHSPFSGAAMMNVVMAIADSAGFDL